VFVGDASLPAFGEYDGDAGVDTGIAAAI